MKLKGDEKYYKDGRRLPGNITVSEPISLPDIAHNSEKKEFQRVEGRPTYVLPRHVGPLSQ